MGIALSTTAAFAGLIHLSVLSNVSNEISRFPVNQHGSDWNLEDKVSSTRALHVRAAAIAASFSDKGFKSTKVQKGIKSFITLEINVSTFGTITTVWST